MIYGFGIDHVKKAKKDSPNKIIVSLFMRAKFFTVFHIIFFILLSCHWIVKLAEICPTHVHKNSKTNQRI